MNKRIILVVIVIAVLGGIIWWLWSKGQQPPAFSPKVPSVSTPLIARTALSLRADSATITADSLITYSVVISSDTYRLVGAEVYLDYDPRVLEVRSITPGTLFTDPEVLIEKIDSSGGRIAYAVGAGSNFPVADGVVATIQARLLQTVADNSKLFVFDQEKSDEFDKEQAKVALISSDGSQLFEEDETILTIEN